MVYKKTIGGEDGNCYKLTRRLSTEVFNDNAKQDHYITVVQGMCSNHGNPVVQGIHVYIVTTNHG